MQKSIKITLFLLFIFSSFSVQAYAAETIEINQLIEQENRFDKTQITIQGEAIGEPMERGDECWVNLNDGTNAIGIKMKISEARRIGMYGNYRQKGDIIQVTGTFYKACVEDGGETDLHSISMKIISRGQITEKPVTTIKVTVTIFLLLLMTFCLFILKHQKSKLNLP